MTIELGLGLIQRCASDEDVAGLVEAFHAATRSFGFDACAGGAWTGVGRGRPHRFFFNSWPEDWLTLYTERQLFFDDPLILEAQRRMTPFRWAELDRCGLPDQSANILDVAFAYGWRDGLVVPVHGPAGYRGVVSLVAFDELDLGPGDVSVLWVMALAIHARCRGSQGLGVGSPPPPRLTARETECMRWIAAGKTEWETGQLLGIAQATVHFHVENVKRRLDTGSRTHAVALLVLHGAL